MTMQQGTYYIGDLCYVINDENWKEVCALMFPDSQEPYKRTEGEMQLKDGRKFAIFGTAFGDGFYDHEIGVDSGTIGCIKVEDVDDPEGLKSGFLTKMNEFTPYSKEGNMHFGEVNIDTTKLLIGVADA